jgi:hypothetical protein
MSKTDAMISKRKQASALALDRVNCAGVTTRAK